MLEFAVSRVEDLEQNHPGYYGAFVLDPDSYRIELIERG
jgi:hypothetical protein